MVVGREVARSGRGRCAEPRSRTASEVTPIVLGAVGSAVTHDEAVTVMMRETSLFMLSISSQRQDPNLRTRLGLNQALSGTTQLRRLQERL